MPRKPKKKSDTKKPKGKRGRKSKASESTLTNMKIVNNKKLNINNDVELPSDKKTIEDYKKQFIELAKKKNDLLEQLNKIDNNMEFLISKITESCLKFSSIEQFLESNNFVNSQDKSDTIKYDSTEEDNSCNDDSDSSN